jgi:hypothetical protein
MNKNSADVRRIKIAYLAHPFSGDPENNLLRVKNIARQLVQKLSNKTLECHYVPFVPHLLLSVFDEENNPDIRSVTEKLSSTFVQMCDELWIASPVISFGMNLEIATAQQNKIPIRDWHEVSRILNEG